MHGTIAYSEHTFDYTAQFSARATMAITVFPDGAIRVIAPEATPQAEVEQRLRKRARWLIRQILHFEQFRPRAPERRYVGGETHLYLGRQYRLKLHKRAEEEVKLKGAFLHVSSPMHREPHAVKRLVSSWYREGKNPDCGPLHGYRGAFRKDGMPATVTDIPVDAAALGKLGPERQDIPQSRPHSCAHRVH
jgi:predicted metal-dependent hydrolase